MDTVGNFASLALVLAVGALLLFWRSAIETAGKSGAEAVVKELAWPQELARQLEAIRGAERQKIRFASYGKLWAALEPLAVYRSDRIGPTECAKLLTALRGWYFSEQGGIFLTEQARLAYLALQDLLIEADNQPYWTVERPKPGDKAEDEFEKLIDRRDDADLRAMMTAVQAINYTKAEGTELPAKQWRAGVTRLAADWSDLEPTERFVVLQQVGSVLRSTMLLDVESRLK